MTSLPIVVKGIQHVDDAREAVRRGVDGIVVSNHGGRQVDGAIASLDALPAIADAVGDDLAVLFDSGIRGGADVAQGAGPRRRRRPASAAPTSGAWRLAGQAGVEAVLQDGPRRARPDAWPLLRPTRPDPLSEGPTASYLA